MLVHIDAGQMPVLLIVVLSTTDTRTHRSTAHASSLTFRMFKQMVHAISCHALKMFVYGNTLFLGACSLSH
jgi:hypothetical protein